MPEKKHAVSMKTSSLELIKADVERVQVARDGERFGTLFLVDAVVIVKPGEQRAQRCNSTYLYLPIAGMSA